MQPQLQEIIGDFRLAEVRLRALSGAVPAAAWFERVDPNRWSVGECVVHLNLTSEYYMPVLREAIARAPALAAPTTHRYRRDFMGWFLWRIMPPPARLRMKTAPRFVPVSMSKSADVLDQFTRLQVELIACVESSNGLAVDSVFITSPFNERAKYNLFACFGILSRHQHRHLWQAEQLLQAQRP